jgi:uncharacterized GH25 family protein
MINKKVKTILKGCMFVAASAVTAVVQAHPMWILPHQFNVSTEEGQGEWVTFDASASHTIFGFDKGIPLDSVMIYSPNGDRNALGSYFKGHRRSVFDLYLDQEGTYRIEGARPPFFFTSYKSGKRDTPKRMMADKQQAKEKLPNNARDVSTLLIDLSSMTYVTNNKPTETALLPKNKGLEVKFISHPNDIVAGEEVEFQVILDGQPAAGVEIEITPGGTKYRDDRAAIKFETKDDGMVVFTPDYVGPWLFLASRKRPVDLSTADFKLSMRYISFEVQPE